MNTLTIPGHASWFTCDPTGYTSQRHTVITAPQLPELKSG